MLVKIKYVTQKGSKPPKKKECLADVFSFQVGYSSPTQSAIRQDLNLSISEVLIELFFSNILDNEKDGKLRSLTNYSCSSLCLDP